MKKIIANTFLFVLSIICLIYPAIINGYPLVYPDTGTYIVSGFNNTVPIDRPIMYSFFLRHISLYETLWLVIIMQAVIVIITIQLFFKCINKDKKYNLFSFITIALLSFTTGISYYTSQIMPDIFSAVLIICCGILLAFPNINLSGKITIAILIIFCNMAHSSNLLNATLILGLLIFVFCFFRSSIFINTKKILFLTTLIISSWLLIPLLNYSLDAGFKLSRAPNIFVMGRLVQSGVLNTYLKDKCSANHSSLCNYIDNLPKVSDDFLWGSGSPLYDGGCFAEHHIEDCWKTKNELYAPVIKELFTTPKYFFSYSLFSINESLKQLLNYNIEGLPVMMEGSPILVNIEWRFKRDIIQYKNAEQAHHPFFLPLLNSIQNIFIIVCSLFLAVFISLRKTRKNITNPLKLFFMIIVSGVIFNAIVCATFSTVAGRFEGRVIWLIPFVSIIFLIDYILKKEKQVY